jgi:hypothetical protein
MKERRPNGYWNDAKNRERALRAVLERAGGDPGRVRARHFVESRCRTLLTGSHRGSILDLFKEIGIEGEPWVIGRVTHGFWREAANRSRALRCLIRKTGKSPADLIMRDFKENNLISLVCFYGRGDAGRIPSGKGLIPPQAPLLKRILVEEGLLKGDRFEMEASGSKPGGYWDVRSNRVDWMRKVVEAAGGPRKVRMRDFLKARLGGLVHEHGVYDMLREAGYDDEPWSLAMSMPRFYWRDQENRKRALGWLLERIGKRPEELSEKDMMKNDLSSLLNFYERNTGSLESAKTRRRRSGLSSLKRGLCFDGFIDEDDMVRFGRKGPNYWARRGNRLHWIRKITEKAGGPRMVSVRDFQNAGCGTFLRHCPSLYQALLEAGFRLERWEMRGGCGRGFWSERGNRRRALRWLMERTGKAPLDLRKDDFISNQLGKLWAVYLDKRGRLRLEPGQSGGYRVPLVRRILFHDGLIRKKDLMKHVERAVKHRSRSWGDPDVRIRAIRQIIGRMDGSTKIGFRDLVRYGIGGMVSTYYGSVLSAFKAAGCKLQPWVLVKRLPNGYWTDPKNRRAAIEWAISRSKGPVEMFGLKDLEDVGLARLIYFYTVHREILSEEHEGRLSSKAPLIKRLLVREGLLKGDGLYGGATPKGEGGRRSKGYERHWATRKERPVRMRARRKVGPKATVARKGRTVWKVTKGKDKVRMRNF